MLPIIAKFDTEIVKGSSALINATSEVGEAVRAGNAVIQTSKNKLETEPLDLNDILEEINKELVENFGGKSIQCCFYNNKLLMMIPIEKDLFETGSIYEAEDFIDDSKSLLKELSLIFNIIDTLKLNMKINL